MNIICFDVETTGLLLPSSAPIEKQPRIIEIGAMRFDVRTPMVVERLSQLINPGVPLSYDITKITGLKDYDLRDKPTFKQFLPELSAFFAGTDVLIAHNAPFDCGMLQNELRLAECTDFPMPAETVCTAQEYTAVLGFRPKLLDVYEHILGEPLAQTHRALEDVEAMFKFMIKDNFFEKIGVA
jgi:DNA polymerase-3 subunit alpha (Gram-positive type)